jgi:hypothetical protein
MPVARPARVVSAIAARVSFVKSVQSIARDSF